MIPFFAHSSPLPKELYSPLLENGFCFTPSSQQGLVHTVINSPNPDFPPQKKLRDFLIQNGFLSTEGDWIYPDPPQLPLPGPKQLERLNTLLDTPHTLSWQLPNGYPLKKIISLRTLLNLLQISTFEIVGGGVPWILGKDYFSKFLKKLGVPDSLIHNDLFTHLEHTPQDFDFRIDASMTDAGKMHEPTGFFFKAIAWYIGVEPIVVMNNIKKKRFSRANDADKFSIATLEFERTGEDHYDFDFLFIKHLERSHLNTSDDLRIEIHSQGPGWNNISFALTSEFAVRKSIVDYICNCLDAYNPETINPKGFISTLVKTIKGRFPIKEDFLARLYQHIQLHHPNTPYSKLFTDTLHSHHKHDKEAFFAAIINANTFLGTRQHPFIFHLNPAEGHGTDTFLGQIYSLAAHEDVGFPLIKALTIVHAYIGWNPSIKASDTGTGDIIQIHCYRQNSNQHLSIFLQDSLDAAIKHLIEKACWKLIAKISWDWLAASTMQGLSFSDNSLEAINSLLEGEAFAGRLLAFFLLIRKQKQYPSENALERIFICYSRLIAQASPTQLNTCNSLLIEILETTIPLSSDCSVSALTKTFNKLSLQAMTTLEELSSTLYHTNEAKLQDVALKILLDFHPTHENVEIAHKLLRTSTDRLRQQTFPHFFKLSKHLTPDASLTCFIEILEATDAQKYYKSHKKRITNFLHHLEKDLLQEPLAPEQIERAARALKKVDAQTAALFSKNLQNSPALIKKKFAALEENIRKTNSSSECKDLLLSHLCQRAFSGMENEFQSLFFEVYNKFAKDGTHNQVFFLRFIGHPEINRLFKSNKERLLRCYVELYSSIETSHNNQKIQTCEWLVDMLSTCEENMEIYSEGVDLLLNLLHFLQGSQDFKKILLKSSIDMHFKKICALLEKHNLYKHLFNFLNLFYLAGKPLLLSKSITENCIDKVIALLPLSSLEELDALKHTYSALRKNSTGASQEKVSAAFAEKYMSLGLTDKAKEWVRQLSSPHHLVVEIAEKLRADKSFQELEDFLSTSNKQIFPSGALKILWLEYLDDLANMDVEKTGHLYLAQKDLFLTGSMSEEVHDRVEKVAQQLASTHQVQKTTLALELFHAFSLTSTELWDLIFSTCFKNRNKTRTLKLWDTQEKLLSPPPLHSKISLIRAFEQYQITKPSLLTYLSPDIYETSPFNAGSKEDIIAAAAVLLHHGFRCLVQHPKCRPSFETLMNFNKRYVNTLPIEAYVELWLEFSPPELHIECLMYMQRHYYLGERYKLLPSIALLNAISTAIETSDDFSLYQFILCLLSSEILYTVKHPQSSNQVAFKEMLAKTAMKIIPTALKQSRESQCLSLALEALECCRTNQSRLFDTENKKEQILPLIIDIFPLLFAAQRATPALTEIFFYYHTGIIEPAFSSTTVKGNKHSKLHLKLRSDLIIRLVNMDIALPSDQIAILACAENHLKSLAIETPCEKTHLKELFFCLDALVFSSKIPSTLENSDEVQKAHLVTISSVLDFFVQKGAFRLLPHLKMGYDFFLQANLSPNKEFTLEQHGRAVARIILRLLVNTNDLKWRKAHYLFHNAEGILRKTPEYAINCMSILLTSVLAGKDNLNYQLKWINETAIPFLKSVSTRKPHTDSNILADTDENHQSWSREIPSLFKTCLAGLDNIRAEMSQKTSHNIPKTLYTSVSDCLTHIHNNQIGDSTDVLYFILYYMRIACAFKAINSDVFIASEVITILKKTIERYSQESRENGTLAFTVSFYLLECELLFSKAFDPLLLLGETIIELDSLKLFANGQLYTESILQFYSLIKEHKKILSEAEIVLLDFFHVSSPLEIIPENRKMHQISVIKNIINLALTRIDRA